MMLPDGAQFAVNDHDRRVALLSAGIGRALGMTPREQEILARGALLHDVGKLGIPQEILLKDGPLTEAEWRLMRTHPELGTRIAAAILGSSGGYPRERLAILHHHERMDGGGYPYGLVSTQIPIEARIVAVADTFEVLTSGRPYRQAFAHDEALLRISREAGAHLDPKVVEALVKAVGTSRAYRHVA